MLVYAKPCACGTTPKRAPSSARAACGASESAWSTYTKLHREPSRSLNTSQPSRDPSLVLAGGAIPPPVLFHRQRNNLGGMHTIIHFVYGDRVY